MKATADHIRKLISDGLLEEGLQTAISFLQGKDQQLYNECIQHQGRLNESQRKLRLGVLARDEAEQVRAMVRYSLIEEVAVKIERGFGAHIPPTSNPQQVEKKEVFSVNFGKPAPPPVPQNIPTPQESSTGHNHEKAKAVINELLNLMARFDEGTAARHTLPLLHPSLVKNGMMRPHFKQNNFRAAHQKFRAYKMPVEITQAKSTNRKAIGSLGNRDEGEEFVYTLAKHQDRGGMPGMIRVFFSKNKENPSITVISL